MQWQQEDTVQADSRFKDGERNMMEPSNPLLINQDSLITRPYSPWQNGVVERSHKIDNELFYSKRRFGSETEMYKSFKRYSVRTNNIARRVLGFKTPNEMVEEYFKKTA